MTRFLQHDKWGQGSMKLQKGELLHQSQKAMRSDHKAEKLGGILQESLVVSWNQLLKIVFENDINLTT